MGYAVLAGPNGVTLRGSGDLIGAHFHRIEEAVRERYDLAGVTRPRHVGYARVAEDDDLALTLFDDAAPSRPSARARATALASAGE
ncbi:hypothetical protein [Halomarina ordinaria]|uniref:Uncharacterized protein n=1 Tax=Halomarina ordinaria TaxID=3033939 RepID=A0ABD5U9L9_9EURY|nr:hypothetical protein [Halomarina sp. PSRA2]